MELDTRVGDYAVAIVRDIDLYEPTHSNGHKFSPSKFENSNQTRLLI